MLRDARLAVRELRRAPAYAAAVVVTVSLAVAANTAVFATVNAVLLRAGPIERPSDLVVAWQHDPARNQPAIEITFRQFEAWARDSEASTRMAAFSSSPWPMAWRRTGDPARLSATAVTTTFFETLGVRPLLGRAFAPGDDARQSGWVAILSHALWTTQFGASPSAVGTTLTLDDKLFTIVGVMPEGFDFPRGADLWVPVVPVLAESSAVWRVDALEAVGVLYAIARLPPGGTPERLAADLERRTVFASAEARGIRRAIVQPMREYIFGPLRAGLWWLLAGVGVLLIVGAANLSGLALTRALAQQQQDAVRRALGATRGVLARRWLVQAALLVAAGAAIGAWASRLLVAGIGSLAPGIDLPASSLNDLRAHFFVVAMALAATAIVAVAPMLAAASVGAGAALNASRATATPLAQRLRAALTTAQVAFSVVVLIAAGLVVRSFVNLQRIDPGFRPDNVLTMQVAPGNAEAAAGGLWITELTSRLGMLAGVEAAGAVLVRPLAYGEVGSGMTVALEGDEPGPATARRNPGVNYQSITPDYFRAMGIPLLRGRVFDGRDMPASPLVVIVSESAARALWPGDDPLGKQLSLPSRGVDRAIWQRVVGVVKDVHYRGLGRPMLDVYEAAAQSQPQPSFITVRTTGDPLALAGTVRAAIRDHDDDAVVSGVTNMEAVLARELAPWRLTGSILTLAAVLTFFVAVLGLVSQIGLDLAQRSRELAIRLAVGARPRHIHARVLARTAAAGAGGLALGLAGAAAATRLLSSLLFGVSANDAPTWTAVIAMVVVSLCGASFAMARRATRLDPAVALRTE